MVTTSQLHTRGQIPPISSQTIRAFAVPAPPAISPNTDVQFSITAFNEATLGESDESDHGSDIDDNVSIYSLFSLYLFTITLLGHGSGPANRGHTLQSLAG